MTIICKNCGEENHVDAKHCTSCGVDIQKKENYLICSTCGISNPVDAKVCSGCGEPIDEKHTFKVENETEDHQEKSKKKAKEKKPTNPLLVKRVGIGFIVLVVLLAATYFTYQWVDNHRLIFEAEDGFWYVTDQGVLHVVDQTGKDDIVGYDVADAAVYKYGKDVYYLSGQDLYHYNKESILVHQDVTSFKVHPNGDKVLFTVMNGKINDLYLSEGEDLVRVDGNVGLERYVFGLKDDVYYVKDITADENLGVMYLKRGTDPAEKVIEDVYTPLFSLKRNSVYYVRDDIKMSPRFDIFYVKDQQVTEVARNIIEIHVNPQDDIFYVVQLKNEERRLMEVNKSEKEIIQDQIQTVGVFEYGDTSAINIRKHLNLFVKTLDNKNLYFNEKELIELGDFDDYLLAQSKARILTFKDDEVITSDFNEGLSNGVSVARHVDVMDLSDSGSVILLKDDQSHVYENNNYQTLDFNVEAGQITADEKYLIYTSDQNGYVYKLGANEPVYLNENVTSLKTLSHWVYSFLDGEIMRYRLGKFSSNQKISDYEQMGTLSITK